MGIVLKINNRVFDSWAYANARMSMDSLAGYFVGTLPNNLFVEEGIRSINIGMGDDFTVEVNGWVVVTGYVDKIISTYNIKKDGNTDMSFSVIGRDKTADLIDCSFGENVNEFKGLSALAIIRKLCAPFNVTVKVDEDVSSILSGKKITTFKANEGESPFGLITKLCRDMGVLPLSYGDGKLTLTKTTSKFKTVDPIILGSNAFFAHMVNDDTNRHDEYIVKGYGISSDNKATTDYVSPAGKAIDAVMKRNRPLISFAEDITDSGSCAQRARWLARRRAGQSRRITYHLFQLAQQDNTAWYPNCETQVVDYYHNIRENMLISDVEYEYEERGKEKIEIAKLTVVDKNMYDVTNTEKIRSIFDRD